ncbi:ABC transporter permease subunit [Nocardioides gilvus]|uniref:ABC transporter permease subunit n=1 Tax=Nocardioides gilvus TaxID=1735589 RepID=UPI000D74A5CD|nr:ABC transporter permease subunit [Nocardioides gilvus]
MSAVAPSRTFDVSGTSKVPFSRLVSVEMRKMADTRAGLWLLSIIGLITIAVIVIFFFVTSGNADDRTFINFLNITSTPLGFLLPVLGILLVTGEWGQRTTLTTFALEPSRMKVIAAKTVAALVYGVATLLLAVLVAAVAASIGGATDAWGGDEIVESAKMLLVIVMSILQGVAFGLVVLNSAGAIVLFFVLPIAFNLVANLWGWLNERAMWLDLATAQTPLLGMDPATGMPLSGNLTGEQWLNLASVTALWIVVPFVIGLVRVQRAEMK